jgi:hypothetical protein
VFETERQADRIDDQEEEEKLETPLIVEKAFGKIEI